MAVLISGSLAFDTVMRCEGRFAEHLLPDQLHQLNVSFQVPALRREFGGCAGNIAYGLRLLGGAPLPVAAVGGDGAAYLERLEGMGISTAYVAMRSHMATAQAMIVTDADDNQITAFHPGAMVDAADPPIFTASDVAIACVAPDERATMLRRAMQLDVAHVPFIFDPGQALPLFDAAELAHLVRLATWIVVNEYEACLLAGRMGLDRAALSRQVTGLVVTLGAAGCEIWREGGRTVVQPVHPRAVCDPTGCGDAFRSGLLFGLERGWSLTRSAALGNQMGACKIGSFGAQNYTLEDRWSWPGNGP